MAQLEAFVYVADQGSMSAAARGLHLTQPALSRRIAGLEALTGLRLFDRTDRRARLSQEGRVLLPHARRVLGARTDVANAVQSLHDSAAGSLRVIGLPSLIATHLPGLAAQFHHRFPHVDLTIEGSLTNDEIVVSVAEAHSDVGLTDLEIEHAELSTLQLGVSRMVAVLPADGGPQQELHRGEWRTLSAADLSGRTLITLPPGTLTRQLTDAVYDHLDVEPARVVSTTQRDALIPLALAGLGVTVVPDGLASVAINGGAVVAAPEHDQPRRFGLVFRTEESSPTLARFLEAAAARASVS